MCKKNGKIGKQILASYAKSTTSYKKSTKKCESDKIINPKTGRCVNKTSKIGKQILARYKNESKSSIDKPINHPKDSKCIRQYTSKYLKRKSPAFPANKCKNQIMKGNDGLLWFSKSNVKGIHRWVRVKNTKDERSNY